MTKPKHDDAPKPPDGLSEAAGTLYLSVLRDFELEPHHIVILLEACWCLTRIEQARREVAADGPFVADRFGRKFAHPGIAVELSNQRNFKALTRELGLDIEPAEDYARGPRLADFGRKAKGG